MKKYLLVSSVLLSFLLSGCFATHSGYLNNSASLSQANFKYVKRSISGESSTLTVLGIGGLGKEALVEEAKADMLSRFDLKPNQTIVNTTVNWKNSFYFALYIANKCTVTADVVEFVKEGEEFANVMTDAEVEELKTNNSFTDIKGTKWIHDDDKELSIFNFGKTGSLDVKSKGRLSSTQSSFIYKYSESKLYLTNQYTGGDEVVLSVSGDKFIFQRKTFSLKK